MRCKLLVLASILLSSHAATQNMTCVSVDRMLIVMGTALTIRSTGASENAALRGAEAAVDRVLEADRRWSSWRGDSQLSRLHSAPIGTAVPTDAAFRIGLRRAFALRQSTRGAFDPAAGSLVTLWGLANGGRATEPTAAEIAAARAAMLDRGEPPIGITDVGVVRRSTATLAEGGFAKGLALDAAVRAARSAGAEGIDVDLGGQSAWCFDAGGHRVTLADPRDRAVTIAIVERPAAGSLATSGNSERGIEVAGRRLSHLLDPRTGRPAPDFGSVTVLVTAPVTDPAMTADCLSTALYVLGPTQGLALAKRCEGVEALFQVVTRDGGVRWRMTPGMKERVRRIPASSSPNQPAVPSR